MVENVFTGDASNYAEGDGMLDLTQEQRAFVEEVAYYANQECERRKAAGEDWVLPSVCVSQACLESGFGSATTVNIFGIKGEGTVAATQEEYVTGQKTDIVDSFISHGTIAEDVKVYYDLICGTGDYEGWDIYSAARNNEDAAAAIRAIKDAGYATDSSYTESVISILDQYNLRQFDNGGIDFEYDEAGYQEGCDAYQAAIKIIAEMEQNYEKAEASIKSACSSKPAVDYQSIIQFDNMKNIIQTLKELLEKTKMIADEEKYLAEQYNEDGGASQDSFQIASMAAYMKNFAFNDMNEFQTMVSSYQKSNSNDTFSSWFQSYVSSNGIESKVVNMNQYQKAIKDSGAVLSSDYVVSKSTFLIEDEKTNTKNTSEDTSSEDNKSTGSSQFRTTPSGGSSGTSSSYYTGGTVSGGNVTSAIVNDTISRDSFASANTDKESDDSLKEVHDVSSRKAEFTESSSTPFVEETKKENVSTNVTTVPASQTTTVSQSIPTSSAPQTVSSNNTIYQPTSEEVVSSPQGIPVEAGHEEVTSPVETETSNVTDGDDSLVSIESNSSTEDHHSSITKIPTINNTSEVTNNHQTTSSGSAVVPAVLGLGAAGVAAGGAAYYYHKKKQNSDYEEYDDESEDDFQEDDFVADNYEEDDNYEEKAIPELNEINDGEV